MGVVAQTGRRSGAVKRRNVIARDDCRGGGRREAVGLPFEEGVGDAFRANVGLERGFLGGNVRNDVGEFLADALGVKGEEGICNNSHDATS